MSATPAGTMNSDPAGKKREGGVPLDRPDRHVMPPVFVPEAPGHHMQIAGLVRKRTKSHDAGPVCMMPDAVRSPQELSRSRYHRSRVSGISPALSMSDGRTDRKAASGTGYRSAGLDRGERGGYRTAGMSCRSSLVRIAGRQKTEILRRQPVMAVIQKPCAIPGFPGVSRPFFRRNAVSLTDPP